MRYHRDDGDVGDAYEPGSPGAIQAGRERHAQREWDLDAPAREAREARDREGWDYHDDEEDER